jgi:hypothetical protein
MITPQEQEEYHWTTGGPDLIQIITSKIKLPAGEERMREERMREERMREERMREERMREERMREERMREERMIESWKSWEGDKVCEECC